jgi:IS1 family transposase
MTNTRNDLQKMQIWADRYKRVFDFKVGEFDRAHESELVQKLRELETAEATHQKYQQQVDALQERADFLKNMSTHATISIFIVETTAIKEKDLGEWLTTFFTGQDEV